MIELAFLTMKSSEAFLIEAICVSFTFQHRSIALTRES